MNDTLNTAEATIIPFPDNARITDITGLQFHRWSVVGFVGKARWLCECQCGNTKILLGCYLKSGHSKSCGCLRAETARKLATKHGGWKRELSGYSSYENAKERCSNPHNNRYNSYGGRGIEFRFASFKEFHAELGDKPTAKHSLDRLNTDGHYEVGNVRWATAKEQCQNKTTSHFLTVNGQTKTVADWQEFLGFGDSTIYRRLRLGWCDECAVTQPLRGSCAHRKTKKVKNTNIDPTPEVC
jgi:hypothetical protein